MVQGKPGNKLFFYIWHTLIKNTLFKGNNIFFVIYIYIYIYLYIYRERDRERERNGERVNGIIILIL